MTTKRPLFTKRHFEAVADWIRTSPTVGDEQRDGIVFEMCGLFERENPAFDKDRFEERAFPETWNAKRRKK